jgi:O-6-methylguanine DNA methyltransferase
MAANESVRVTIAATHDTTLGTVWVALSEHGLVFVEIQVAEQAVVNALQRRGYRVSDSDTSRSGECIRQLSEYLDGQRQSFDIPLDWAGLTPFQVQALPVTCSIPYCQTRTYGELARQIGRPRAARAVGRAEATNPMPLVIPCHRVIGEDGKLHGYGAGNGL